MNIALHNLGCSKNQVDGERMLARLAAAGHRIVSEYRQADAILVNTCAFIEAARQEAIEAILDLAQWKTRGRCRLLAVCGCFSQRYAQQARRAMPEVDHWFGVHSWQTEIARVFGRSARTAEPRVLTAGSRTAYLKIAEGCSRRCSFCAIPAIRGPYASRPPAEVLAEARWLEGKGTAECILVSQDTSSYGRDAGSSLTSLVELLLRRTAIPWLRLMYLHPSQVDASLLRLMAAEPRLCPYLDIPLQHIADPLLRSMRRSPPASGVYRLIERIRATAPQAAIRSSFIVGYPGETEARFRELLRFISWARLDKVGVFAFSPEQGTAAYHLAGRPRQATAQRRCDELMALQAQVSRAINRHRIGREATVIVDGAPGRRHGRWDARGPWDAPEVDGRVLVSGRRPAGPFARVRISGADEYDLEAVALPPGP